MRRERGLMTVSLVSLLLGVVLRLLEPWPLKFVFDRVISPTQRTGGRFWFIPRLDSLDVQKVLIIAAAALVLFTCLRAVAEYVTEVAFANIGNRVLTAVRNDLYRHVQGLDLGFHTSARGGDLIIRMINDVNMLRDAAATAVLPIVAKSLVLVGMWSVMFWLNWRLAVLALATVPLLWLRTIKVTRRIREAARRQRQKQGDMAALASEAIASVKIVQAFGLEGSFGQSFDDRSEQTQKEDIKTAKLGAALERSVDILLAVATGLVLWYGATLVLRHKLSPGDLLVFLTYLRRAFNPVQDFAKYTGRLGKATAAGERVIELLDRPPLVCDRPDAVAAPAFRGDVRLENVTFGYDPDAPAVLEDLSLEVPPGECVAVAGPSGIGKSTLANLLLRFYDPDVGRLMIDGRDVRDYTLKSLRNQVAVVLQDSVLFATSVRDNIAHGKAECTDEEVIAAARLANAHEFISAMPNGYATVLGERGASLSGGQRQRIAIARAAIRQARLLVLDEPTSGLDEENARAVVDALARLWEGRTTFLITHDLQLASRADRIVYLEGRRIAEAGTHAELMRLGGRYATLYRMQITASEAERRREEAEHALAS
jgi:ATP-binding cassette subfamily B protein